MIATVVALARTAACTCAERPADPAPDDELLQRRVAGCEALCAVQVGDCGPLPNAQIKTQDDCVRECASVGGDLSSGWGYQYSTEEDSCAAEWQQHTECIVALSCGDQQLYWQPVEQPPPPEQRPCHEEWEAMTNCVFEHPCCTETQG